MKLDPFSPIPTREALARLPDIAAQEDLNPPPLTRVYVPVGHQRALSLDSTLVIGMRGAGKSLWTAVLQSDKHRSFVAALASVKSLDRTMVRVGWHGKVELEWRTVDLYALVLTYLANDEQSGKLFRKEAARFSSAKWVATDGIYTVPRTLLVDEDARRAIVEAVAGPWMGISKKRASRTHGFRRTSPMPRGE